MLRWCRGGKLLQITERSPDPDVFHQCISDDCLDLIREVLTQYPFEKATVVGRQIREGCPRLRPERDRGDAVAPDQLPVRINPIRIGGIEPLVKPVNRSRQVGIRVQLRHQHGNGRCDITAGVVRLSSALSLLDSVEPQRVVQTPRFLADKQGIGVDDADRGTARRCGLARPAAHRRAVSGPGPYAVPRRTRRRDEAGRGAAGPTAWGRRRAGAACACCAR